MQQLMHYHFTASHINDAHGPAIMLEQQEGIEDTMSIMVHPWQLRAACEHLGIMATDKQAECTIATLTRRIKTLAGRIERLAEYLETHSDTRRADLSYEQTYARATADIAGEFIAEMDGPTADDTQPEPKAHSNAPTAPRTPTQGHRGQDANQLSLEA
ncbi:hypothetical protein os4_17880 [Comamonadaceae bacterium OS-4]|nr:hypothetical protein os4_17880 [Comamonadaceae bacterium OS-4]